MAHMWSACGALWASEEVSLAGKMGTHYTMWGFPQIRGTLFGGSL